jgi:hypothetical protein
MMFLTSLIVSPKLTLFYFYPRALNVPSTPPPLPSPPFSCPKCSVSALPKCIVYFTSGTCTFCIYTVSHSWSPGYSPFYVLNVPQTWLDTWWESSFVLFLSTFRWNRYTSSYSSFILSVNGERVEPSELTFPLSQPSFILCRLLFSSEGKLAYDFQALACSCIYKNPLRHMNDTVHTVSNVI